MHETKSSQYNMGFNKERWEEIGSRKGGRQLIVSYENNGYYNEIN